MSTKEYYKKVNKRKQQKLGVSIGSAQRRLMKQKLFQILQRIDENNCYRCGKKILSVDELSFDHILPWYTSDVPRETYFDLANVTFSHLRCNAEAGAPLNSRDRVNPTTGYRGVVIKNRNEITSYRARINIKNKNVHIGYFKTPREAAQAFDDYVNNLEKYNGKTNKELGLL